MAGPTVNPYRFGGQVGYRKDSANTQYARARHLHAEKARLKSVDPVVRNNLVALAAMTFLIILISVSTEHAVFGQPRKNAVKSHAAAQHQALKQGWEPITYKQGCIIAVGPYVLCLPLKIPERMLLAHKAFVSNPNSKRKKVMIDFFFSPKYETEIQKWAANLPKNYPIALPVGQSPFIAKVLKFNDIHSWNASSGVESKHGEYYFMWMGTPGCAAINKSMKAEYSAGSAAAEFPKW